MRNFRFISGLIVITSIFAVSTAADDSSCVRCHANDAVMKGLFVPPVLASSEGEG